MQTLLLFAGGKPVGPGCTSLGVTPISSWKASRGQRRALPCEGINTTTSLLQQEGSPIARKRPWLQATFNYKFN